MNPADEIVAIVDKDNQIIGSVARAVMRQKGLIHRASYVLVFNTAGQLFVQKRTANKDMYPGYYDVAAGGVVLEGESYGKSARRELHEELGIRGVEPLELFDFYYHDEATNNRVWGRVFSCVHDGPFILQPEEVAGGAFFSVDEVLSSMKNKPFTPDGVMVLQKYKEFYP